MTVPRCVAGALEAGSGHAVARALARLHEPLAAASVARPVRVPPGLRVLTVGGATRGGSGATPLAIACAALLADAGARVVFVGHGYGARPGPLRLASPTNPRDGVGDEAFVAARALASRAVPVVVAPRRSAALAWAASRAEVVVVDGAVQLRPQRADLALLAVDAAAPWGAGAVPPAGDLRAPVAVLRRAADAVVAVGPMGPVGAVGEDTPEAASAGEPAAHAVMPGVEVAGALLPWASVRALRLGLVTALARPDRIVRSLAHHGVTPQVVVSAADHGPARAVHRRAVAAARGIDLWVATRKCAVTFAPLLGGALATLAYTVVPNPALRALCLTRCGPFASPPRAERTPRPRP